jgi:deazaflavin-dependent oxidoreductase (nitroreductase family)
VAEAAGDDVFLYLTTRGRTSGLPRTIEIWFVALEGKHFVVSEGRDAAGWVKNLRKTPEVSFSVGTRGDREMRVPTTQARARPLDEAGDAELRKRVTAAMDAKYGWSEGLVVEIQPD